MDDAGDRPASPPLARGSYHINFDEFDDSVDPFKPRGGLSNSPGKEISNPFQTRLKMASSPPNQTLTVPAVENHDIQGQSEDAVEMEKADVAEEKVDEIKDAEEKVDEIKSDAAKSPAIDIKKPGKSKKKVKKKVVNKAKDDVSLAEDVNLNEENPFATKTKIGQSPPLDEDPFKTKTNLGSSPQNDSNFEVGGDPFQTKTKLGSSPQNDSNFEVEENPFQSKNKLGSSPQNDSNFEVEVNPFQSKNKLVGSSPQNDSNFEVEENPFQSKNKLGSSPQNDSNLGMEETPFQTKNKLGSSPQNDSNFGMEEDPFQSQNKLGVSPPKGSGYTEETNIVDSDAKTADEDIQNESVDSFKTAEESLEKSNKGLKTRAKSQTPPAMKPVDNNASQEDIDQDGGSEPPKPKPEKKTASPKKSGIKKPKARSKFKPPPNFGVQSSEDVVIFAPPPSQSANNDTASDQIPADIEENGDRQQDDEINDSVTNQMTASEVLGGVHDMIDSVHDFGACEMPMESNEDFVPASEAFNEDDEAWDMMERMKHENGAPQRDSLTAFDPLSEQPVPDKVTTRRVSDTELDGNSHLEDEDLLLMNTPPAQKNSGPSRGVSRHPAARALQEHVDGDGAPREAQIVDKMLFSPGRGEEGKPRGDGSERYFDAPEYPLGSHKAQSEIEVERMNAANKKHGTGSDINQDSIVQLVQVLKYSQSDWNKMKQELELDFNARILNKEREWSKKLADRDKKINYLDEQVLLFRSSNDDMKLVVTEFEKTIAQLQAEKLKTTTESQQGYEDVIKERDQALEDLQSVETAFSDLHQRYERTKGVVEGFKKNEDVLKKCVTDYQNKLKTAEDKTVSVRQQAEEKLALASEEMEKLRKTTTSELARLEAALKKAELKTMGLERSLEQKVQENSELTAICDELIAKVSTD